MNLKSKINVALLNIMRLWTKQVSSFHKRNNNIWVFGEWYGLQCIDNCMYFANYVKQRDESIKVYWIAKEQTDTTRLLPGINVLIKDSPQAVDVLKHCGVACFGQSFEDFSSNGYNYTEGAISILLWHGIPWKKIGHDTNHPQNILGKLYYPISSYLEKASYYISTSKKYDAILSTAFDAKPKQILKTGYPRNSVFYKEQTIAENKRLILNRIKEMNRSISLDGCRIVVYMPTFRNSPNAGRQNTSFSFFHLSGNESFLQYIEQNNIIIVEKAHHVCQVRDELGNNRASDRIVYLKDVSAQELLCSADLLVTDYSGAFFDFLILDRPIIHFLYDYDYYRTKDRGLYYDKEEVLAGEEATDQEQLIQAIKKNMEHPELYSERRKMIRDTYLEYDSAQSCENLYHEIKARLKS